MSSYSLRGFAVLVLGVAVLGGTAGCDDDVPAAPVRVVARVNGEPIHLWRLAWELHHRPLPPDATPPQRMVLVRAMLDDMVERHLLVAEARRRGLWPAIRDVDVAFEARRGEYPDARTFVMELLGAGHTVEHFRKVLAERLAIERLVRGASAEVAAIPSAAVAAYHAEHPDEFFSAEEVRALHIVVATEEEIRQLRAELAKGVDFGALARTRSTGPEAADGGDLGFFARGALGDPFDTCFFLDASETSAAIESDSGFHLFKVVERRPARRRDLAEARAGIERKLRAEAAAEAQARLVASLLDAATIEIDEAALGVLL